MSELIWRPTAEYLEGANLSRFMARYGIGSYEEMVRRSVEDVAWYWSQVERDLGLEWERPYDRVLDTHQGIEWATWFGGGLINIAHNCVDRHATGEAAERTALIEEREDGSVRSRTYRELAAEVGRLANGLRSIGIARGDRVGVYLPMCVEAVVSMMAIAKIGAVYLPVFSGFAPAAVAARLEDAGAKALISADGYRHRGKLIAMKEAADEAAHMVHLPITLILRHAGRDVEWHRRHDVVWDELLAEQPTEAPTEPTEAEDVWMIAYTSGTTGKPKGAVHVHGGFLVKVAAEVAYQVDCKPGDVLHWVTDMGWIMGPWETVGTLALGGTVLLHEGTPTHPGPDRLWALCERHGVTILGVSPTLIRSLMPSGTGPVESHDLSCLRILASTGEPWNPEPYRWYFEHVGGGRCPVINLSGGTEIGACLLSPYPITALKTATLRGPSLGMDVDVVDAEGHPVRGGVGELVCRQPWPSMTRGIWGDPDRYLAAYWSAIPGVWHHGDWASIDEDGFWFLHGRSDDTINVAGRRIGPAEIESILVSDPAVVEAAVVGLPHEVKGEALWCFCVLAAEREEGLAARLADLVDATIGKPFRPERVVFVRDLPRTRSAKIVRRAIRAVVRGEDPGDISSLENPGSLAVIGSALASE
ncbi:MAG TPA: AMP-binding protein [Actinomycetota bacterium]|jgi:acetyl-CoA synthetase|nr:AMP-binding protein [Actinomycetota bacterium]